MGLVIDCSSLDIYIDTLGLKDYIEKAGLHCEKYIVVSLQTGHEKVGWAGKSVSAKAGREICNWIIDKGYKVVQVGTGQEDLMVSNGKFISMVDRTDIFGLACIIKGSAGAVCVDSFPLHIAQALKTPVFALFGATLPENIITDYSCVDWFYHPELDCIGCFHYKAEGGYNRCLRGDTACMNMLPLGLLKEKLEKFLNNKETFLRDNHLALVRRSEKIIQHSEAMSQDLMTYYRVLRDFMDNSLALRITRKILGIKTVRTAWMRIGQPIKRYIINRT